MKVNIPLLDIIKQVPAYAKFLKDLCTIKKGLGIEKKAFLTEPIASGPNHVPIILGRPFLATANAIINCRNGVMQLTFGNMTLELNIFHLSHKHKSLEGEMEENNEVCSVDQNAGKPNVHELQEIANQGEAVVWEFPSVVTAEQLLSSKSPSEKEKINKEKSSSNAVVQTTAGVKELLLLDPP